MKPRRTDRARRCLCCLFVLTFLTSLSACGGSQSKVEGKWEATIASKRTNQPAKVIFEFLPDGTFQATPSGDTTVVEKDKYQVQDDGRTVKMRAGNLFHGEAVCKHSPDAMQCESDDSYINFKKL